MPLVVLVVVMASTTALFVAPALLAEDATHGGSNLFEVFFFFFCNVKALKERMSRALTSSPLARSVSGFPFRPLNMYCSVSLYCTMRQRADKRDEEAPFENSRSSAFARGVFLRMHLPSYCVTPPLENLSHLLIISSTRKNRADPNVDSSSFTSR